MMYTGFMVGHTPASQRLVFDHPIALAVSGLWLRMPPRLTNSPDCVEDRWSQSKLEIH